MGRLISQLIYVDEERGEVFNTVHGEGIHLNDDQIQLLSWLMDNANSKVSLSEFPGFQNEQEFLYYQMLDELATLLGKDQSMLVIEPETHSVQLVGTVEESTYPGHPPAVPPFSVVMMFLMVLAGIILVIRRYVLI
ncbi:MAG: hypothetical protein HRU40_15765 [Saprospiraceae bacterium]|nr:hypothetical protein [Saprospiraceae bacterium]